jgi:hypothetical protein
MIKLDHDYLTGLWKMLLDPRSFNIVPVEVLLIYLQDTQCQWTMARRPPGAGLWRKGGRAVVTREDQSPGMRRGCTARLHQAELWTSHVYVFIIAPS